MGDFKKNPEKPYEVGVPNKIRKRIAMHEKHGSFLRRFESTTPLRKILSLTATQPVLKRGSLWSRFSNRVKKFLK